MAYMMMYILNHVQQMPQILKVWEDAGAPGITILGCVRNQNATSHDLIRSQMYRG